MSHKTNVMRLLDKAEVSYSAHNFLPLKKGEEVSYHQISERTGVSPDRIFKTILAKGGLGNYYVLVIQGMASVDLKKVAAVFNEKSVQLADLEELLKVTGYVRGGCSPIGMKKPLPTVIDEKALEFEKILVSAGKRGYQVEINPKDLVLITGSKVADIHSDHQSIF
jgi:Cys-tRNA(Pro)/Cys-tRNA(Cys) deacylase